MAKNNKKSGAKRQKPLYVAKKSLFKAIVNWKLLIALAIVALGIFAWLPLLAFLVIPVTMILVRVIQLRCKNVEFYDGYVVQHSGVIARDEMRTIFPHIVGIMIDRTFLGAIFNYGDVLVDVIGNWDINLSGVRRPAELRKFLEGHMMTSAQVNGFAQRTFVQE